MQKSRQIALEDSNVAGLGGAEDKAQRLAAAQSEPAWKGAGDKVGVETWRVENKKSVGGNKADFGVARWPEENFGRFFDGDSFIVLQTYIPKGEVKKHYNLFFWIGKDSTQDEYGVAAYKTVELDDLLGGKPVQHREIQGGESARFLAIYPNGIEVLIGGIEGGFNHVKPREYKPRLLQVQKVGSSVKCFEVTCDFSSLHDGDVFILDAGTKIHVWAGAKSSPFEKNKATSKAEETECSRGNGCERVDADEEFWTTLGGTEDQVATEEAHGHLAEVVRIEPHLYSLETDTWKLVKTGTLTKADIDIADVMCINVGVEMFIVVGEDAPEDEKMKCMMEADAFLTQLKMPRTTPVMRVNAPNGHGFTHDNGFLHCFAEEKRTAGWMAKRVGVRPLYKRYYAEVNGKALTFYDSEEMATSSGGVIDLSECSSVQSSVAPGSGATCMEIVTSGRTYRVKFDDESELMMWCKALNQVLAH